MPLSKQKIEHLSEYYLQNGFEHTTEEIVAGLEISHKTFFNRYKSKENSVNLVIEHWFENVRNRFLDKAQHCNHAVEELLQFFYEIHYINLNENTFFNYILKNDLLISEEAPFRDILEGILHNGISHYQFRDDFNVTLFSKYLLNNLTHYIYQHDDREDVVNFMLAPILSVRGKALLNEMDLEMFL